MIDLLPYCDVCLLLCICCSRHLDLTFDQGFFRRMEERRAKGACSEGREGRPNRVTGSKVDIQLPRVIGK